MRIIERRMTHCCYSHMLTHPMPCHSIANINNINNILIVPFLTHRVPISIMDIEITNMKIRNVATNAINDRYVRPFRMDPAAVPSSLYRAMNSFPVCRVAMMAMAVVYEATIITTGTVFHFSI